MKTIRPSAALVAMSALVVMCSGVAIGFTQPVASPSSPAGLRPLAPVTTSQVAYSRTDYGTTPYRFANPQSIAVGPRRNVWVANSAGNSVTEIPSADPRSPVIFSSAKYHFVLPTAITADPSGNIWVGSIFAVTEIPAARPQDPIVYDLTNSDQLHNPYSMTSDPYGNIWIGDNCPDSSDRPFVTEIPKAHPASPIVYNEPRYDFSLPDALTSDPSGNIWVANQGNNSITEIPRADPSSPITFHPGSVFPDAITSDPSGNIWLADELHTEVIELPQREIRRSSLGSLIIRPGCQGAWHCLVGSFRASPPMDRVISGSQTRTITRCRNY